LLNACCAHFARVSFAAAATDALEGDMQNPLTDYNPEMETLESDEFEWSGEMYGETSGDALSESEVMEMAAELLEVADEEELEQFLGSLIKKVGRAVGKVVRSPVGRAIGGMLKGVAKKALPLAGGALGAWVGGPLGAQLGSSLASMAGSKLGLELEGLSPEDREFEAAKHFVRFASDAVKTALAQPASNPATAAKAGVAAAAQRHAPGLLRDKTLSASLRGGVHRRNGRWYRKSGNIVVVNV